MPPHEQQAVIVADAGKRSTTCGEDPLETSAARGTAVARPSLLVAVEKAGSGSGAAIVTNPESGANRNEDSAGFEDTPCAYAPSMERYP